MGIMRQAHIIETGIFDFFCITILGIVRKCITHKRILLVPVYPPKKKLLSIEKKSLIPECHGFNANAGCFLINDLIPVHHCGPEKIQMRMTGRPELRILHDQFLQKGCILPRGEQQLFPGGHLNQLLTLIEALCDIKGCIPAALIDHMGLHSHRSTCFRN